MLFRLSMHSLEIVPTILLSLQGSSEIGTYQRYILRVVLYYSVRFTILYDRVWWSYCKA